MPSLDRAHTRAVRARIALIAYLVFVAFTVWLPAAISGKVVGLALLPARWAAEHDLASYQFSSIVLEFVANIVFLIPVGLLISLGWPRLRVWHIMLIGALMSGLIEAGQSLIPTRAPSLSDVIANTLGALIGGAIAATIRWRAKTSDGTTARAPGS